MRTSSAKSVHSSPKAVWNWRSIKQSCTSKRWRNSTAICADGHTKRNPHFVFTSACIMAEILTVNMHNTLDTCAQTHRGVLHSILMRLYLFWFLFNRMSYLRQNVHTTGSISSAHAHAHGRETASGNFQWNLFLSSTLTCVITLFFCFGNLVWRLWKAFHPLFIISHASNDTHERTEEKMWNLWFRIPI